MSPNLRFDHGYAILRLDPFEVEAAYLPEAAVTVQKVVWSQDFAEAEVERLNKLNQGKGARYFWQVARVERTSELTADKERISG